MLQAFGDLLNEITLITDHIELHASEQTLLQHEL